jgi:hypothetical protein
MNEREPEVEDATLDLVSDLLDRWLRGIMADHALYGSGVILAFDEAYPEAEEGC